MKRWIWPFELLEKIGEGGMGVVYRARYVPKDRVLAVKMLSSEGVNGVFLARFERELDILKALRHPNIVHCFGGVCEDKQRFYAMELVDGGTLDQMLRERGKLPWDQTVEYALQMCAALSCAHQHGVIHRDVKPGNFLVTGDGRLKLSDFGLATVLASQRITAADKTMGTYLYMAPEQIRGAEMSARTDLYALGCVLFEMISGRPLFDGQSPAAILHRHLKEPPPRVSTFASDCPPDLERLILELLEKDPERRPESADAVAERLRNLSNNIVVTSARTEGRVGNRPVEAPVRRRPAGPAGPPGAAVPRAWRISAAWAGIAVLLAALLGWGLVSMLSRSHQKRSVDEWVQATNSESADVRLAATEALGRIGSGGRGESAVETLAGRLNDPDPRVRAAAAKSLGSIGRAAGSVASALTKASRTDEQPMVRNEAEAALRAIREDRAASSSSGWLRLAVVVAAVGIVAFLLARRGRAGGAIQSRDGRKLIRTGVPHHDGR
ncbi:MAG TPA: protein kinase [Planctomycetaceae bacterium]|nr:protein kinase [Planctomycetaceae bacterium]